MAIVLEKKMEWAGFEYAEGYEPAFNTDTQKTGVVKTDTNEFHMTFPLNGWRARELAEKVLGKRDAALWSVGKVVAVPTQTLIDLPGFDSKYVTTLETVRDMGILAVLIEVVTYNPGYGRYIILHTGMKGTMMD